MISIRTPGDRFTSTRLGRPVMAYHGVVGKYSHVRQIAVIVVPPVHV